jgi:hypothetical protein
MQQPEQNAQLRPVSDNGKGIFLYNQHYVFSEQMCAADGLPDNKIRILAAEKKKRRAVSIANSSGVI